MLLSYNFATGETEVGWSNRRFERRLNKQVGACRLCTLAFPLYDIFQYSQKIDRIVID